MTTIYAIYLKDWNMAEAQPQEYFTTLKKAQIRMAELAARMDSNVYDLHVSPLEIEAIRKVGNQAARTFTIQSINVQ